MQRTKSKILSILLSLVMLLSLLPTTALAASPTYVRMYNENKKLISLNDGECLTANDATGASSYTGGAYVARYDSGTLYLKGYHGVAADGQIYAHGDLNIEVVSDSSFSTSVSATNELYGIQADGKLNISGSGKLTVTANGNGDVYGICANEGVTISAPLNVQVGKVDSSKNGPVYGIYTKSGAISLSGNDMTVTATGGTSSAYGVYNAANTSTAITNNGNIDISGKLTVNLNNGNSINYGIYTGSGSTITLDDAKLSIPYDATLSIPSGFNYGIFNNDGNVVIKNRSDVTLNSGKSGSYGIWAKDGGNLTIADSNVTVSAKRLPASVDNGSLTIKDSTVDLTLDAETYRVVQTHNGAANTIDLSGTGSVTLTASGEQTSAMIGGKVTATPGTKLEKGTHYPGLETYDGAYDEANNITVLQFVHKDPAPTANISVSNWPGTTVFPDEEEGYAFAQGRILTIDNKGEADTGELTITVEGANPTAFTVNPRNIKNIAAGGKAESTVRPAKDLPAGTYTATLMISGANVDPLSINVQFTVKGVTSSLIGDVNGDGTITADDLTALARHVAKISIITDTAALARCDVTKDGSVTADDLTMLARYVAKIISSFA